jgi:hypothetical protein
VNYRILTLLAAVLISIAGIFVFPAIPQNEAYHAFADTRIFLGIPHFFDVVSNSAFLIVGILGMRFVVRTPGFVDPRERWPYLTFFAAVALTAFGSAWYHLNPNDNTLIWDRIPMAIGFMALVSAMVAERINTRAGLWLLGPLAAIGVASVIYWEVTQAQGRGDLRPYALAQFGSLLAILLLMALFPARYTRSFDFVVSLVIYALAKIFEASDRIVFSAIRIVSGHTLKHLAAALSTYWILRMLHLRTPVRDSQPHSRAARAC